MEREELIKKWLDDNLNATEQQAFEQLEDYQELNKMDAALKSFKAPEFSARSSYDAIKPKLKRVNPRETKWVNYLLKIAAVLIIGFAVNYYTSTLDTEVHTQIAKKTIIELPDASTVHVNSNSLLVYNERDWKNNRKLNLNGEAFFKVAKGKKFDVVLEEGVVSVLGTQFNVKQRNNYFEVTCYEGSVAVSYKEKQTTLKPGDRIKIIDGKLFATEKIVGTQPNWLRGESSFKRVPLKYVINELENQYDITISAENIDNSRLFTGNFTHKNLDLALKTVTIPLNLSYSKSGNSIVLKRE